LEILFIAVVGLLAFANGANDNFKGVATLWGGGDLTYRQAWIVANGATLLGALLAVVLGASVAATFSGKGVITPDVLGSFSFAMAFAAGAGATVLLATLLRYPISTTHSILGSLAGAGMALAAATFVLWKVKTMLTPPQDKSDPSTAGRYVHILSGSAVCFSRAVNDTPKIASIALLGAGTGMSAFSVYAAVGVVMTIGGMVFARRIAEVMSQKITGMNAAEGLTGNLVTAFLVIFASKMGLAVSTTHVSVGSLFGIGAVTGKANTKKIVEIILSWVLTLPIAFILAFAFAKLLG